MAVSRARVALVDVNAVASAIWCVASRAIPAGVASRFVYARAAYAKSRIRSALVNVNAASRAMTHARVATRADAIIAAIVVFTCCIIAAVVGPRAALVRVNAAAISRFFIARITRATAITASQIDARAVSTRAWVSTTFVNVHALA